LAKTEKSAELQHSPPAYFHEISFDDIIAHIQPWYNFFANGHRQSSLRNISQNESFSVLIKMYAERSGQSKN